MIWAPQPHRLEVPGCQRPTWGKSLARPSPLPPRSLRKCEKADPFRLEDDLALMDSLLLPSLVWSRQVSSGLLTLLSTPKVRVVDYGA